MDALQAMLRGDTCSMNCRYGTLLAIDCGTVTSTIETTWYPFKGTATYAMALRIYNSLFQVAASHVGNGRTDLTENNQGGSVFAIIEPTRYAFASTRPPTLLFIFGTL